MATQTTMMNNPLRNAMAAQGGGRSPGGHTSPSAGPPGMTRHRAPVKPPAQSGQGSVIVHLGGAPSSTPSNQPPPPPPLSSAPTYIFAAAPPARDEHVKGSVRQHTGYVPAYKRDKYALATPKQEDSPYMAFQDKLIRNGFIRKVFGILVVQLALTIGGVALMLSSRRLIDYVQGSPALFWSAWGVTIIVLSALLCCEDLRRRYPLNYILLFVFVRTVRPVPLCVRNPHSRVSLANFRADDVRDVFDWHREQLLRHDGAGLHACRRGCCVAWPHRFRMPGGCLRLVCCGCGV